MARVSKQVKVSILLALFTGVLLPLFFEIVPLREHFVEIPRERKEIRSQLERLQGLYDKHIYDTALTEIDEMKHVVLLERHPKEYADLALLYSRVLLRSGNEEEKRIDPVIASLEVAEKVYFDRKLKYKQSEVFTQLGRMYLEKSSYRNHHENYEKAKEYFIHASKTEDRSNSENYYRIALGLGSVELHDAEHAENENLAKNIISRAIQRFELVKSNELKDSYLSAVAEAYSGDAFVEIANIEDYGQNMDRAIERYKEALSYLTLENYPIEYASFQLNLCGIYLNREGIFEENASLAAAACQKAAEAIDAESTPVTYGLAVARFASAQALYVFIHSLSNRYDSEMTELYYESINNFFEAKKLVEASENPTLYGTIQLSIGAIYIQLAKHGVNKDDNIQRAREALQSGVDALPYSENCKAEVMSSLSLDPNSNFIPWFDSPIFLDSYIAGSESHKKQEQGCFSESGKILEIST